MNGTTIAAITICQPYAELIVRGEKRVENRTWATSYRGQLLIHAGKSRDWLGPGDLERYPDMPFGALVGGARLVACVHLEEIEAFARAAPARWAWLLEHKHALGPFCWVFERVHRLAVPVACRGGQGIWRAPGELVDGAEWIEVRPGRG